MTDLQCASRADIKDVAILRVSRASMCQAEHLALCILTCVHYWNVYCNVPVSDNHAVQN